MIVSRSCNWWTDRRLRSWLSGAVLTTSQNRWDDRGLQEEPPRSPPLSPTPHHEQHCGCSRVRFLGTTISQDLKEDNHIDSIVKKARQRLYFLRQLKKFNLPQELLKQLYSAMIETVRCSSITVWFGSATQHKNSFYPQAISHLNNT